jgi:hypothetical protein
MAENDEAAAALGSLNGADASQLAAMIGQVSDEQLAEGMANPDGRRMVLDEIFKRMSEHAEPSQIQGIDAVVHFEGDVMFASRMTSFFRIPKAAG